MALLVAERSSSLLESPVVQMGLLGGGAVALWYWYNESVKDRCIAGIGGVGGDVVDEACEVGKKVLNTLEDLPEFELRGISALTSGNTLEQAELLSDAKKNDNLILNAGIGLADVFTNGGTSKAIESYDKVKEFAELQSDDPEEVMRLTTKWGNIIHERHSTEWINNQAVARTGDARGFNYDQAVQDVFKEFEREVNYEMRWVAKKPMTPWGSQTYHLMTADGKTRVGDAWGVVVGHWSLVNMSWESTHASDWSSVPIEHQREFIETIYNRPAGDSPVIFWGSGESWIKLRDYYRLRWTPQGLKRV
jgi:hypothetical protein